MYNYDDNTNLDSPWGFPIIIMFSTRIVPIVNVLHYYYNNFAATATLISDIARYSQI